METPEIKNKAVITNFMNATWKQRDLDLALTYVADDVSYYGVRNEFHGKDKYAEMVGEYMRVFDHVTIEFHDWMFENNKVFFRATFTGNHYGEFEGIPPTNKKITFKLFNLMEIVDGKISGDWDMYDELGLMQQMGLELVQKEPTH